MISTAFWKNFTQNSSIVLSYITLSMSLNYNTLIPDYSISYFSCKYSAVALTERRRLAHTEPAVACPTEVTGPMPYNNHTADARQNNRPMPKIQNNRADAQNDKQNAIYLFASSNSTTTDLRTELDDPRWEYALHLTPLTQAVRAAVKDAEQIFFFQVFSPVARGEQADFASSAGCNQESTEEKFRHSVYSREQKRRRWHSCRKRAREQSFTSSSASLLDRQRFEKALERLNMKLTARGYAQCSRQWRKSDWRSTENGKFCTNDRTGSQLYCGFQK